MRPAEIDHSSKVRHYFDISNGEVLAGKLALAHYLAEAPVEPGNLHDLGELLRHPEPALEKTAFEPLDTSQWSKDKLIEYGRWINRMVSPPETGTERQLNSDIIRHAHVLGVGPTRHALLKHFDRKYSNFYLEIGVRGAHTVGTFRDWSLEDFTGYLRRVGGERRPTMTVIDALAERDPTKPRSEYMRDRFRSIGGFNKLQELAGYPVIRLWEREDFIEWGVKFMEANDGKLPTALAADFLSTQKRGPGGKSLYNNFGSLPSYQIKVIEAYYSAKAQKEQERADKIAALKADLLADLVPIELFCPHTLVLPNLDTASFTQTDLAKYAKYKLLNYAFTTMAEQTKLKISGAPSTRQFIREARHNHPHVTVGDIEHAALILGFFDDLWPMDGHMQDLKLGNEYTAYVARRKKKQLAVV